MRGVMLMLHPGITSNFAKHPKYHNNITDLILLGKKYQASVQDEAILNNINPISKIKATLTFSLSRQAFLSRLEAWSIFDLFPRDNVG